MNSRADYLGRPQCEAIKGFFILMVFVSHFMQYVAEAGGNVINLYIGQCMVAPFLFYSGYGVMESIKAKGIAYVHAMPRHRILTTLLNFDIAVFVFIILDVILGRSLTGKQVLLSVIGWDSVGNSAWYIFVVLVCYCITYLSAICFRKFVGVGTLIACIAFMLVLSFVKPSYWYDTMLCFPVGMLYSERKAQIENICKRFYWIALGICVAVICLLMFRFPGYRVFGFAWNVKAIVFTLAIVLFTMRFPVKFSALEWCGRHLFPLYIYQRIPMIIFFALDPKGFANWRMPVYLVCSLMVTIFIAAFYPRWQVKL